MANTFSQLYIQIVFTVKGRQNLIPKQHKEEIHKYITGITQERKHKLIAINSMPDHVHIFVGIKPDKSISDLVRDIKSASSGFISDKKWSNQKFSW
jgi:putative transposase